MSTALLAALPGFLNDPLYGLTAAGLLFAGAVACFTKVEQPLIGLVLLAASGYIGWHFFTTIGN